MREPIFRFKLLAVLVSLTGFCGIHRTMAQSGAPDPLEKTSAYSLLLPENARPLPGYYPMGFVHGLADRTVQEGFSSRQSTSRGSAFFNGQPFPEPGVLLDPYGLRYYSLAWAAEGLGASSLYALPKKGETAKLPFAIDADGTPATKPRARVDVFDPKTRELLLSAVRAHVEKWSVDRPGLATGKVIDQWGLDNEWEGSLDYSPAARVAFAQWLEKTYAGDLAAMNHAWKTNFAGFEWATQGKLPAVSDYKTSPGMFLDWHNFQTENFVGLLGDMARTMHDTDPEKRGVVHKSTQQTIEMPAVNRVRTMDHALFADLLRPVSGGLYGIDMYGAGDRQAYEINYIYNCILPRDRSPGYGVMLCENNNHGGPGHAFASTNWRLLPNGLKAVNFFTTGFAGAKDDWDKFGFLDPATGKPKDKMFYVARWANMVHRTEKFWTESMPAPGLPRLAMLMPRRDVLLSDLSPRYKSQWAYPEDHRWLVFRWLREQGYWVDVIPYTKLTPEYLKAYEGLLLVGADHLTTGESAVIGQYVAAGGALIADSRAGFFDEHHAVKNSLDSVLGVRFSEGGPTAPVNLDLSGKTVSGQGFPPVEPVTAREIAKSADGKPAIFLNTVGKGRALFLDFMLGSLVNVTPGKTLDAFLTEGPTADSEEYVGVPDEFVIGGWLTGLLRQTGLKPAYHATPENPLLRVEQPVADAQGNCAVIISNRADSKPQTLPAGSIELPLPGGPWSHALWAPAEDDGLQNVAITAVEGGKYRVDLPEIATAGVLYLSREHPPLLGIPRIAAENRSVDGQTAKVEPGKPFTITVQLANTTGADLPEGSLKVQAVRGWKVAPEQLATPSIAANEIKTFSFEITPETDYALIKPDWIYPLTARWSQSGKDQSICTANVEVTLDPSQALLLLSDNAGYPATWPYQQKTGVSYRYLQPSNAIDPVKPAKDAAGPALLNGFNNKTGGRFSGDNQTERYASYNAKSVDIVFDLQSDHEIRQIAIAPGPGNIAPSSVQIFTGVQEKEETLQSAITLNGTRNEISPPVFRAKARYVRIHVEWPEVGGTLNEVEIWGR